MYIEILQDFWIISFQLQKRQLAVQSGPFNLNDKVFCELFPDAAEVRALM